MDVEPRCSCGKLLAVALTRPWAIRCGRCKADNSSATLIPARPLKGTE